MTPNTSVAWQVCKGPRHFASALTSEYNHSWSATVERPPVFTIWASTPEGSNYDEAGRSVIDEAMQADTFISVDPRTTNLGKESDIHLALKGGTDTALALAHVLRAIIEATDSGRLEVRETLAGPTPASSWWMARSPPATAGPSISSMGPPW